MDERERATGAECIPVWEWTVPALIPLHSCRVCVNVLSKSDRQIELAGPEAKSGQQADAPGEGAVFLLCVGHGKAAHQAAC